MKKLIGFKLMLVLAVALPCFLLAGAAQAQGLCGEAAFSRGKAKASDLIRPTSRDLQNAIERINRVLEDSWSQITESENKNATDIVKAKAQLDELAYKWRQKRNAAATDREVTKFLRLSQNLQDALQALGFTEAVQDIHDFVEHWKMTRDSQIAAMAAIGSPEDIVFVSKESELKVGSKVQVVQNVPLIGFNLSSENEFYFMGIYDGSAYFMPKNRSHWILKIPKDDVNIPMRAQDYPYLWPQTLPNCIPKATAYLQEISTRFVSNGEAPGRQNRNLRENIMTRFMYMPGLTHGVTQISTAYNFLVSAGIPTYWIMNPVVLKAHLRRGGKALLAVAVTTQTHSIEDKYGGTSRVRFQTPSPQGGNHAMIAVGYISSEDPEWDSVILIDPASGEMMPVLMTDLRSGFTAALGLP